MSGSDWTLFAIKAVFVTAAVVAVVAYVILPIVRVLSQKPHLPEYQTSEWLPDDLEEEAELQIPQGGKPNNHSILEEARNDPRRTAALISAWMREK